MFEFDIKNCVYDIIVIDPKLFVIIIKIVLEVKALTKLNVDR